MATDSLQQETSVSTVDKRRLHGWALTAVLASLMLANFLSGLDQVIVDTAMPHIVADLQGFDRYTWVITAYLLCFTMMVPIAGKLSDQFGRKWLLMGAIALFLASSALAGASQTMNQLIVFRGMQGLSAGAIQTLISTIVADIFSPAERPRWQGLNIGVFTLASVIGPTTGGWITDHLSSEKSSGKLHLILLVHAAGDQPDSPGVRDVGPGVARPAADPAHQRRCSPSRDKESGRAGHGR
jgi:MFS family permease